jgi:hypothetical protein
MPRPAAARGEGRGADGGERENRHGRPAAARAAYNVHVLASAAAACCWLAAAAWLLADWPSLLRLRLRLTRRLLLRSC